MVLRSATGPALPTTTGFSGLINALEGSRARIMKAKDADEE
jgi:hypothetical protein